MTAGTRIPSWRERENNRRRERRRRAVAAKIYAGLRMYGNYTLPKHCDNNEVLKALCNEAGWTVEEDGTTYRKGCRPTERMDVIGGSISASPYSSYQPSPCASSPASSSFPSPVRSNHCTNLQPDSLFPWLKNLPSLSSSNSSSSSKFPHHLFTHGGSISAPVTPPLTSPTCQTPRNWNKPTEQNSNFHPTSTPPSPGNKHVLPASSWVSRISGLSSPTFSLVAQNPAFGVKDETLNGLRTWTPAGQNMTCSPSVKPKTGDVAMLDSIASEFVFGCNVTAGLVKPWEGERIHEESVGDDLELTLGSSQPKVGR